MENQGLIFPIDSQITHTSTNFPNLKIASSSRETIHISRPKPNKEEDVKDAEKPQSIPPLHQGEASEGDVERLKLLSRALTLPSAFGTSRGEGWKQDGQVLSELLEWRNFVSPRILREIKRTLIGILNRPKSPEVDRSLVMQVTVSVSRFLGVSSMESELAQDDLGIYLRDDSLPEWDDDDLGVGFGCLDGWMNRENQNLSKEIVHLLQSKGLVDLKLIESILLEYIKPLFSISSQSGKLNSETGRAKPPPSSNLVDPDRASANLSRMSWEEEESLGISPWKGTSLSLQEDENYPPTSCQGGTDRNDGETRGIPPSHHSKTRDPGLGSWNVLAFCSWALKDLTFPRPAAAPPKEDGNEVWERNWPRILPPLMALLEDPDPRFRFIGSEIVSQHVLGSNHRKLTSSDSATAVTEEMSSVTGGAPAQLLMRTGLAKLLESCLKVSLSFTNDEKWGAFLLNSSIWSLRGLILKVTKKPLPHPSSKGKEGEGGGGLFHDGIQTDQSSRKKVRGNQGLDGVEGWWRKGKDERELSDSLTNLINQSIFSNWSFLTLSTSPSNQRVAIATCQVLPTLLKDLGIQSSRLISIILDWSCGWLSTLRFDSVFTFRKISLALKSCQMVLQVIQSLFKHSCLERQEEEDTVEDRGPPNSSSLPLSKRVAPGLETWSKKVLTSSLRLWTRFNDQVINEGSLKKKTRNEKVLGRPSSPLLERDLEALRKDLEKSLRSTFSLLFRLVPSSRKLATRIVELDPILFKPVIESF